MDADAETLEQLIETAYQEPVDNQQSISYKNGLKRMMHELRNGKGTQLVMIDVYHNFRENDMIPVMLPANNQKLYQYTWHMLLLLREKELKDHHLISQLAETPTIFDPYL
ncbi:hypothetical protein CFI14_05040 [Lactiplantibacillus pentosus]|uniref:hypothetical protein n=1 Tax=Lactiplantibacillus pentosus TaxID=1589 RepID=UPI000EA87512|nr:hypothetical protein [Lactiplantibacillus pentosus]AYG37839.1 hypothetical protein CFK27_07885 [Lactiplantibacillus pentosus]AYG40498.1 hypothetical protein CFI14_05040 [Lactiplantibacillus pentosus]MCJ8181178.1 hypothetical protein [Lactiplantibacillus pentosus]